MLENCSFTYKDQNQDIFNVIIATNKIQLKNNI